MATKASAFCDNLLTLIYFHLLPLSDGDTEFWKVPSQPVMNRTECVVCVWCVRTCVTCVLEAEYGGD